MHSIKLPSGNSLPVLGLGTWRMGEHSDHQQREVAAIHAALDLGISLIDTAEMYGEGGAELVIAEAIRGRRDQLQLVSKFYPHNASRKASSMPASAVCNDSVPTTSISTCCTGRAACP